MKTTRDFICCADRYRFDFDICNYKKGWAQVDTGQDASYYGTWAHPGQLKIVSFMEGDIVVQEAENPEEFANELRSIEAWNKKAGYSFGIDGMCDQAIIDGFISLGLGEMLH